MRWSVGFPSTSLTQPFRLPCQQDFLFFLLGPIPLAQFVRLLLELVRQSHLDLGDPLPLQFCLANLE